MEETIRQTEAVLHLASGELEPSANAASQSKKALPAPAPRRAIVVDDNQDARESLAMLLRQYGFLVRTARDGEGALEAANEFAPHIMFIDIVMPGVSGYRVAELLRQKPALQQTTLVAVSGWADETARWLSKNSGLHYHLEKPLNMDLLETILNHTTRA
jgi:two-component system, chemotaxis family, CheB/CheR fusion protein